MRVKDFCGSKLYFKRIVYFSVKADNFFWQILHSRLGDRLARVDQERLKNLIR